MLTVVILNVIMQCAIMLNDVTQTVIILNVNLLKVVLKVWHKAECHYGQ